jgi:hypothetical protein
MLLVAHLQFSKRKKPSKKNKRATKPTLQDRQEITMNNYDRKEGRSANMGLASCGLKCLNSNAVFQIIFSAGLTVLCSEIPHERQAPKR